MTIEVIDSRVGPADDGGTLTLDGKAFESQTTTVALTPSTSSKSDGDSISVLSGVTLGGSEADETTWTLDVGIISDFTNPSGLVEWCRANAGRVVNVVWTPNSVEGPTYGGGDPALQVRVRPLQIGGEVRSRLTPSVTFPVVGEVPAPTWVTAGP